MSGRKENQFIVIENGQLTTYFLDDKRVWEIGRPSKDSMPDIKLHSATVSRRHGKFQNMDGVWFYMDYNGKNGTVYNHRHIGSGLNGRIKPVMLQPGDVFVFGGGAEEVINHKTIWGMFLNTELRGEWKTADSRGYKTVCFASGGKITKLITPNKGTVVEDSFGIAIYMGDLTYMIGDMKVAEGSVIC